MGGIIMKQFDLAEYLKNPSRKVVTRSGKPVIIHCTNYESDGPIIAEVKGYNKSRSYQRNGRYYLYDDSNYDLFFAPEKHEKWINIYRDTTGVSSGEVLYNSRVAAEEVGKICKYYVATVKVEWEE